MTTQKRKSIPAGIVDGNKTRRDRSIGRTKINRMESVNDAVTGALLQVFKNKLYVPLYPFKTIVQYLLREEASEAVSHDVIDYASIPSEEMHLQIKMVIFGDSGFVGTKHLVKIISANSVKELKPVIDFIRTVFGNQVMHTKTDRIEANFIEVFHVNSCLGLTLVKPRQHRIEMIVEVVIRGRIDESINLFIRRILEDAHTTETSSNILTSALTASIRGVVEVIDVYSMRERRQQVVNTLKAAVLDEGDICLECLVRTSKALLSYGDAAVKAIEPTEGFTRVRRWYKLSYLDETDPASPAVRCFASNPLQSVALGVFSSLKDADMYLKVLAEHLKRMHSRTGSVDPATASSENATLMLNDLVNSLCSELVQELEAGELCDAGESMLLILALMTCQRTGLSHAMQQVRRITFSSAVHICAVRDALRTLQQALSLLAALVQQSPAVLNQLRGNALSEHELQQLTKINAVYGALVPAVKQVRVMLLELLAVNQYSELQYLAPHLMSLLWQLFDPVGKAQPLLSPEMPIFREKGIASAVGLMASCGTVLHRLCAVLHVVELTTGTEVFISTIKQDLLSFRSFSNNAAATLDLSSLLSRVANRKGGDAGEEEEWEESSFPVLHTYKDLPKCLSDLIGYAMARTQFVRHNPKHVQAGDYAKLVWRPASVSRVLRTQLVPEVVHRNKGAHARKGGQGQITETEVADREQMQHSVELGMERIEHLWDFYALLGEYNVPRLGGVDFPALLQEEWERYDVPRFMCIEGAKLRYLTNTHVTRALHEGMFDILTGPTMRPPLPALCRHLFKFPPLLPLWNGVSGDLLLDFVMQPARQNRIQQLTAGSGLHIVKLQRLPDSVRVFVSGGVLGSDRVLSGLGAHIERVFLNSWQIPPLFLTPPASRSGMHIKVFTGVALTTAAEWCRPRLHRLRAVADCLKARKKQQGDGGTEENVIDQSLLQPTSKQTEKARLFALFSTRNKAQQEAQSSSSAEHVVEKHEAAEEEVEYVCSDDEGEGEEEALAPEGDHNYSIASANAAPEHAQRCRRTAPGADVDSGVLRTLGEVELEVVVRINYETSALLDQVRSTFAREVGNSCRFMQECNDWKLTRVVAYRDGEKTADFGTKSEAKASIYPASDLGHPGSNSELWASMEEMVAKCGTAVLEAGMLYPDADSRLSKEQLVSVFHKLIHRSAPPERTETGPASARGGGEGPAGSSLFSADFRDINSQAAASNPLPSSRGAMSSRGRSAHSNHSLRTPNRGTRSEHPHAIAEEDENSQEQNQMLDPTFSDLDRVCRDSFVRKLLQQELFQAASDQLKPVLVYVPCRIRFTLLAQLTPRMTWGVSALRSSALSQATPQTQGQSRAHAVRPQEAYSIITGHQANPLSIGNDQAVARLVSSTLWLSVEAARSVWGCARDGEAQCLLYEGKQRHAAYHKCVSNGQLTHAYRHALVNSLLTQNYRLSASLNRAFSGVPFQLKRLIETMEVCRHAICSDNTTFDINAVAMTLARHVCLGYRYLITSPQIAHLRGGCAYLLKGIKRLEVLLKLGPIDLAAAARIMPRHLGAPSLEASSVTVSKEEGARPSLGMGGTQPAPGNKASTSAREAPARPKAKPEDRDFEAGLAVGIRRAQVAEQSAASRRVPFEAPPPPLNAALLNSNPPAQTGAGSNTTPTSGTSSTTGLESATLGEIAFRRALAQPARLAECAALMQELVGMSHGLLFVLSEDLRANFPDVDACMSRKPASLVEQEQVPVALKALGLRAHANQKAVSDYTRYVPPGMVTSIDALDSVLGRDCSIEALVAYIRRAETHVNAALDDPDFERHILDAATVRRFKIAQSEVLSDGVQERLSDLQKIAAISADLTEDEKSAVKEIVFSSALPPSKKSAIGPGLDGAAHATTDAADHPTEGATVPKGRVHRTATMRFRAGAEVIKLLAEGAAGRKLAARRASQAAVASYSSSAPVLTDREGLVALGASDSTTTISTVDSAGDLPASGAPKFNEPLMRLHRVNTMVLELAEGKKGIASLLKKMNMQLNSNKPQQTALPTLGEGEVEAEDGTEGNAKVMGVSDSLASLASVDTVGSASSAASGARAGLSDIHNVIDDIFKPKPAVSAEAIMSLAPSNASLASASSVRSEADVFFRPPIAFPLSRFHDEAVRHAKEQEQEARRVQHALEDSSQKNAAVGEALAESELSDEAGEDIMLASMRPAGSEPHFQQEPSLVPPAVRVFQQAEQLSGEGTSMLQLLRSCVQQQATESTESPQKPAPLQRPALPVGFDVLRSPVRDAFEPPVERGGMLDTMRRRPKPDYQAPQEVYF